jgi:hypothetical protein
MFQQEKDHIWMERLLLPLARNGTEVDMLVGIAIYGPAVDAAEAEARPDA